MSRIDRHFEVLGYQPVEEEERRDVLLQENGLHFMGRLAVADSDVMDIEYMDVDHEEVEIIHEGKLTVRTKEVTPEKLAVHGVIYILKDGDIRGHLYSHKNNH